MSQDSVSDSVGEVATSSFLLLATIVPNLTEMASNLVASCY